MKNDLVAPPKNRTSSKKDSGKKNKTPMSWEKLQKKFAKSNLVDEAAKLFGRGTTSPILWLVSPTHVSSATQARVAAWHESRTQEAHLKSTAKEVFESALMLSKLDNENVEVDSAILGLAVAQNLRRIAPHCSEDQWRTALERIRSFASSADIDFDSQTLLYQIVSIEIPLTLAFYFPELEELAKPARKSAKDMGKKTCLKLDGDGAPDASCFFDFGMLAASWSRSHGIIRKLKLKFNRDTRMQLEWVVRQVARMSRYDRTLLGGELNVQPMCGAFISTLLGMSEDATDKKLLRQCIPQDDDTPRRNEIEIEESTVSEWGESGLLQCRWQKGTSKVAINFANKRFWIEAARQHSLIRGDCTPQISINGGIRKFTSNFDVNCWINDDCVDYLELSADLEGDLILERQILLAREDEFLLINDTVVCPEKSRIDYQCHFPLANGVSGLHETETREIYLQKPSIQSLVLPLALPEWKVARTDDSFKIENDELVLTQSRTGEGMFAGLFFDLRPGRSVRPRTWRQLTIAENLQFVESDQAVAFRIQIGDAQWIFYQAVKSIANRTFLGENTMDDFFIARFDCDGDVEELLRIE